MMNSFVLTNAHSSDWTSIGRRFGFVDEGDRDFRFLLIGKAAECSQVSVFDDTFDRRGRCSARFRLSVPSASKIRVSQSISPGAASRSRIA